MGRRLINRQYKLGSRAPSMQTITGDSGIANLSPYLTINSTTVAPTFLYHGNDATATTWPAQWGNNLTIAGSGTAPTLNQPIMGNGITDSAVKFNAGEYYIDSLDGGQVATEDFVIEAIISPDDFDGSNSSLFSTRAGAGNGVLLYRLNSSNKINLLLSDGTLVQVQTTLTSIGDMHYIVFLDRSGSGVAYVNGVQGTAAVISGSAGTLATTGTAFGANTAGSSGCTFPCSYLAMWQGAAWLDTHLQAAVALERFQRWSGIYPTKASGTAAPTYSRACSAYATKWNGTSYDLINCSAGLPRVDYVLDDSGTPFKGMLIEPQATNLLTHSNDMSNAAWGKTRLTVSTTEVEQTPVPGLYYQGLVPSADTATHSLVDGWTAGSSANHTTSFIAKKGSHSWVMLVNNVTTAKANFDIENGVIGVTSGIVSAHIEPYGDGSFLCWMIENVTAGSNGSQIYTAESDNDIVFAGDGATVHSYVAFAQVELGNKPTSRIYTAGASATRLADDLQYNGDNVTAGQGTIKAEMLVDAHTPAAELSIAALSDGGSTDEMVRSYVDTGTQVPIFNAVDSTVAQWTITGSTDVVDGDIHTVRLPYETNDAKQYVDSALDGTPDTSCTVPTALDEIDIGQDTASANQLNGRIRNVEIYSFASSDV